VSDEYLRIGQAAGVLGVSVDTLRRWEQEGRLTLARSEGGQRRVALADVRRLLEERRRPARPVAATSARNAFEGVVTRVTRDEVVASVEVQAGPHRLVALITAESVDDLGLDAGVEVVASVKATHVVLGLPAR
jgi:molybdopterin-binding protein